MVLDENIETFMLHFASFILESMTIHLAQKTQITLLVAKTSIVLAKYLNFANVFLKKLAIKISK